MSNVLVVNQIFGTSKQIEFSGIRQSDHVLYVAITSTVPCPAFCPFFKVEEAACKSTDDTTAWTVKIYDELRVFRCLTSL